MKSKLKKMIISFIIMMLFNIIFSSEIFFDLGIFAPHVGLLYVFGLLLGPYGALGAVLGNILIDFLNGYAIIQIIPSAIISFGVSYLAYKLWYSGFKTDKITKPILNTHYHLILFLSSIIICGFIYSASHAHMSNILFNAMSNYVFVSYLLNFINIAFIIGILGIWLSKKKDFIETPKTSKKSVNKKLYRILFYSLIIVTLISSISFVIDIDINIRMGELVLIGILLFSYLTKPFEYKIQTNNENTIIENIIRQFLLITFIIAILGVLISILNYNFVESMENVNLYLYLMPVLIITDIIIILFFIPGIYILKYINKKVIKPLSSFSEIERFIIENEKIESEGLLNIYSKYINEKNEIGTLARSYTELIKFNNNYIENINEIEGEKKRIKAELDIATKIQASKLPIGAINTDDYIINGYSHPAKEVGGDFFDYYPLNDDDLAIVIGDASGKGVPAALLAMITQVMIKQLLKNELDPSKVLYQLNNQLYENNNETMFITLWVGIYNKTTGKIIFSNAGHNPPLIKENDKFKYLDIDTGIALGVMENFEYVKEELIVSDEIVLYTDGITDANNDENEMYGEERLLNYFNKFKQNKDPIKPLLNDINKFTASTEQFDDMTILYLKIKHD